MYHITQLPKVTDFIYQKISGFLNFFWAFKDFIFTKLLKNCGSKVKNPVKCLNFEQNAAISYRSFVAIVLFLKSQNSLLI